MRSSRLVAWGSLATLIGGLQLSGVFGGSRDLDQVHAAESVVGSDADLQTEVSACGTVQARWRHLRAEFAPGTDETYIRRTLSALHFISADIGDPSSQENFTQDTRWPGTPGDPIHLTWSFVPDGTLEPVCPGPLPACPNASLLFQTMDASFGSRSAWVSVFEQAFQRWEQLTGITFERVVVADDADDGSPITPSPPGGDGPSDGAPALRGDIRIRAVPLDGPGGLLSYGNFPDDVYRGDITLDTNEPWASQGNPPGAGFHRAVCHEIGHAIGLDHVCPFFPTMGNTKLMEWAAAPTLSTYGPQHDDLRGAQRHYGDPKENNDSLSTATIIALPPGAVVNSFHVGAIPPSPNGAFGPASTVNGLLSLDGPDDVDYYQMSLIKSARVTVRIVRVGLPYANCPPNSSGTCDPCFSSVDSSSIVNLGLEILDRTGRVVLYQGDAIFGSQINYVHTLDTPYFYRVFPVGPNAASFTSPQCYDLQFDKVEDPGFDCPSWSQCQDGDWTNGVETCSGGICSVYYTSDCNRNWIEDAWDIQSMASQDCNLDGIPDECQEDCNGNGFMDACDIVSGFSADLNGDGVPDECQPDCNANGTVDAHDIETGASADANGNEVPDECETIRRVPDDYPTINAAVQNAQDGDTVLIAAGTWVGAQNRDVLVLNKTLQIVGEGGPFDTIIDMQGQGRAFRIEANTGDPRDNRSTVRGLTFVNGQSLTSGGAILVFNASTLIERCIFKNNMHAYGGSAIGYVGVCVNEVRSCFFWQNHAPLFGGAVLLSYGPAVAINNCTFVGNTGQLGAAVYALAAPSGGSIRNSIIRDNVPADSQIGFTPGTFGFIVEFSDLPIEHMAEYGGGAGNIFLDPVFKDSSVGDLHIKSLSPCKNAGFGGYPPGTQDIDGQARSNGHLDMGADEFFKSQSMGSF